MTNTPQGAYYNELDPYNCQWLKNLMKCNQITEGDVDGRSIEDVAPQEINGYLECHFFAGIGVWSHALRKASYIRSDKKERLWTGSCPCQPFSAAGEGKGFADERHLWPAFFWLIDQCRPELLLGEQVAYGGAAAWLALVQNDLEAVDYATGAVNVPACGFGGPHIRQRAYWVAYSLHAGRSQWRTIAGKYRSPAGSGGTGGLGNAAGARYDRTLQNSETETWHKARLRGAGQPGNAGGVAEGLGHQEYEEQQRSKETKGGRGANQSGRRSVAHKRQSNTPHSFWRGADWLGCTDGKFRPVESGTQPLAHGAPQRVGRLRGYGNAIVAPVAIEFIKAALACRP